MGLLTDFEHNLVGSFIIVIGLIGLNVNKNLYNMCQKKTEPNMLIYHLLVNNFALILIDFFFPIVSSFQHKWAFNDSACTFYGSTSLVFGYNIMLTVVMLCLELLFQKSYPNYETWKVQVRNLLIGYMWVNSLFWGLAPVLGWSRISQELTLTSCTVDFVHADAAYKTYIISSFIIMFAGPIVAMIFCALSSPATDHSERFYANDKKVLTHMVWFVLIWTPYAICYMWPLFADVKNLSVKFNAAAPVIAKLSVIVTPMLIMMEKDNTSKNETKKAQKSQ